MVFFDRFKNNKDEIKNENENDLDYALTDDELDLFTAATAVDDDLEKAKLMLKMHEERIKKRMEDIEKINIGKTR